MYLIVICAFIISLCNANPYYISTASHDIGCIAAYRTKFLLNQHLPICLEGGLWNRFQCLNAYNCFCVYVDTGRSFPLSGSFWSQFHYYSYYTAARHCPIKTQKTKPSDDRCRVPHLNYPCNLNQTKFVYNLASQSCEPKVGCSGFPSRKECERECAIQTYDACSFPEHRGSYCFGRKPVVRYRHDPTTGRCVTFFYTGCGGNSNNYESIWDCERKCVSQSNVSIMVTVDSQRNYNLTLPQWVVNRYQLSTNGMNNITEEQFDDMGNYVVEFEIILDEGDSESRSLVIINGNPDRKSDNQKLRETFSPAIICEQPSYTGYCKAYQPRWYYNATLEKCVKFIFGGCRGNGNNFQKAHSCTRYCKARYEPNARELIAPVVDENGNELTDLLGNIRIIENANGEVLYEIPTTKPASTAATTSTEQSTIETAEGSAIDAVFVN